MKKRFFWITGIFLVILLSGCFYINSLMEIITGYAAKNLCSAVFISERDAKSVQDLDLNFSLIRFTNNEVDYENKIVISRFLWGTSKALYRDGFGSVILHDDVDETALAKEIFPVYPITKCLKDTADVFFANRLSKKYPENVHKNELENIAIDLIDRQLYKGTPFSFMVVYKDFPIIEYYKEGFDKDTRLLSWSMAKSFTNAIAGVMTAQGMLDIYKPTGIEAWQNDDRKDITTNDLMQMQSGLEWNEDYGSKSDVNLMLHCESDMGLYALNKPYEYQRGTQWYYSSGSTNIVCYLMKNKFESNAAYYDFVINQFFRKINIINPVFETDLTGTYIGSSYIYATTRDFARFGLLYLHDGIFNGEKIFPDGWVHYTTTAATASNGQYGSFFWLNKSKTFPDIPEDAYYCSGHDGQKIFIIPSRDVVVVLLGYSPLSNDIDFNRLVKNVLEQIDEP